VSESHGDDADASYVPLDGTPFLAVHNETTSISNFRPMIYSHKCKKGTVIVTEKIIFEVKCAVVAPSSASQAA
jgi:hypothetical protein